MGIDIAHEFLTKSGWLYIGESCGCNGMPKKRKYQKNGEQLQIEIKRLIFQQTKNHVWQDKKPIHQLYSETTHA